MTYYAFGETVSRNWPFIALLEVAFVLVGGRVFSVCETTNDDNYNCQQRDKCPIPGNCLAKGVNGDGETKIYIGMTANDFK